MRNDYRYALFVVAILGGMAVAFCQPSRAEEKVLLLNGFEPDQFETWAKKSGKRAKTDPDGAITWPGMAGRAVAGDATQGKYAMVTRITGQKYLTENGLESIRRIQGGIFKTFDVFRGCYPEDWSAYAKFRMDVKSEDAPLRLRVCLEDAIISPFLTRIYEIPKGDWVTVEFDLAEAARLREVDLDEAETQRLGVKKLQGQLINLKKMAGIYVVVEILKEPSTVNLDNLRLVVAGAEEGETKLAVLTDKSPFPTPKPLPPGKPQPREALSCKLNTAPVEWEAPVEIPIEGGAYGLQPFDIAPVDNDRMLMAIGYASVLKTADGGKTWTGMDGTPNKLTLIIDHNTNAPGRISVALGPDILTLGTAKCSGRGTPVDSYSVLAKFDNTDWKPQPRGLVDVDDRHCPEHRVRACRQPNGRLWACWLHEDRWYDYQIQARCSDDEGATWRDPTANGLIELETRGKTNPYTVTWWLQTPAMPDWTQAQAFGNLGSVTNADRHMHMQIAPWGDQVVCAYVSKGKLVCAFFDGTKWSEPKPAGISGQPSSMAHFEGKVVYMATSEGKVYRLDGENWVDDSPPGGVGKGTLPFPGCDPTRLSVAGNVLVACWTDGKKLFTSQKPKGGEWSPPREIFNEERGVHHIGAPARSVDNFVPFVWAITKAGARFVRIPVKQPGK
ncbi:MAG: hypothetical protein V1809_13760 [Planctomycetota bacterium]